MRTRALRVVAWQFGFSCLMFLAAGVSKGFEMSVMQSVLLGALLGVVPNLFFAVWFFAKDTFMPAKKVLNSFYIGEFLKIVLVVGLWVSVLRLFSVNFPWLLGAYAWSQASFYLAGYRAGRLTRTQAL